jgi:tungstate transport system substrate-binding protein
MGGKFFAGVMLLLASAILGSAVGGAAIAAERFILLQSTTSTENSGFFREVLPKFTAKTGIEVRVVAVGTGQAIKNAMNGDGDVLLVHDRAAEEKFVSDGYGTARFDVMYNDYLLAGPSTDPVGIAGEKDIVAAFRKISTAGSPFVSRGDDSGTHKVAAGMNAYVLTDRATWSSFKNRRDLTVMVEGDPRLFNPYSIILVNPKKHPHVKAADGQSFIDWMLSAEGQAAIADFKIDGQTVYFPDAKSQPR